MATINIAEFATEINTDARTARKFLRSVTPADAQPGKGSRWSIERRDIRSLKSKFAKFEAALAQAKLDAELARRAEAAPETITDDAIEPTNAELAAIDDEAIDID